jgi:hypothetical protein
MTVKGGLAGRLLLYAFMYWRMCYGAQIAHFLEKYFAGYIY